MGSRRQIGSSGSTSCRSFGWSSPKLKCRCGVEAIIRTVRNGDNASMKFYGCPKWLEQLKKVEKNLGMKEDELNDTKMELCHTRMELMKASRNEKNFSIALFVSWIFFAFRSFSVFEGMLVMLCV
uniref:GRF-type domain-containing protein n=1 Tax=Chenopodium quinoa TaxID=63459 RepID=A0A803MMA1_CHEQI